MAWLPYFTISTVRRMSGIETRQHFVLKSYGKLRGSVRVCSLMHPGTTPPVPLYQPSAISESWYGPSLYNLSRRVSRMRYTLVGMPEYPENASLSEVTIVKGGPISGIHNSCSRHTTTEMATPTEFPTP